MLKALLLLVALAAKATDVGLFSIDASAAGLRLEGHDVIELRASEDDGLLERRPELKAFSRLQRGLGPGPDRSLLTRLTVLERAIEPFNCRPYGVLFSRLRTAAGPLDVYATQLAGDSRDSPCREQRVSQAFELAEIISRRSAARPYLLLARPPKPDDEATRVLIDLLNLTGLSNRLFAPRGAERWINLKPVEGGLLARLDSRFLTFVPRPDRQLRAAALKAVLASIDRHIAESHKRERLSWIPVYGLAVSLRQQRLRERLESLKSRAETARIRSLPSR